MFVSNGESGAVIWVATTGLLAAAANQSADKNTGPILVYEAKAVRDACPQAVARGIHIGAPLSWARRLCPTALVVPVEQIDASCLSRALWDGLANISPVVEPDGADAAYADLSDVRPNDRPTLMRQMRADLAPFADRCGFALTLGCGPSRLAARACGLSKLPPERLGDAPVSLLWPEDSQVCQKLFRLGLLTWGDVAQVGEAALVYQFGKIGRQLYRRASTGRDMTSVRALYPPPRADASRNVAEFPVENSERLDRELNSLAHTVAVQLARMGRHGRRVVLDLVIENGCKARSELVLAHSVQEVDALYAAARRLINQMRLNAPVVSLRLRVEETELPSSQTLDLFQTKAMQERPARIAALERYLASRYGPQSIGRLKHIPLAPRDVRRSLVHETQYGAAPR